MCQNTLSVTSPHIVSHASLGYSSGSLPRARDRYQAHFGPPNQRIDVDNHTALILFDAPELVDEDYRRHAAQLDFWHWRGSEGGAVQFIKNTIERTSSIMHTSGESNTVSNQIALLVPSSFLAIFLFSVQIVLLVDPFAKKEIYIQV